MPTEKIILKPGINTMYTPTLNTGGWSESNLIRFRFGIPEKLGGWQKFCDEALLGIATGLHAWVDELYTRYLAAGTARQLAVVSAGQLADITPIRDTANIATPFDTTITSTTVVVNDISHGAVAGDDIIVPIPVAVGGIIIFGRYTITVVNSADEYEIEAADAATSTVTGGGDTPEFTTTNLSDVVTVTLVAHGLSVGDVFPVQEATTVGGITLDGEYLVITVTDADNFTITAAAIASSSDSAFENGDLVRIEYLLPTGAADVELLRGFGTGAFGMGPFGSSSSSDAVLPLSQWFLDNWGQSLVACRTNGTIYYWVPPVLTGNPAIEMPNAPEFNTGMFVAMPQRQVIALGAEASGTQDPLLVRWCDVEDFTVWTAATTNQAGSFRLATGSRIVSGFQAPTQGYIWTDIALWTMQYVGPPFIYSFREVAKGCGLIAPRAFAYLGGKLFWMCIRGFFTADGEGIRQLPCPVWDQVFPLLDTVQADKICGAANSPFNEMGWFFPSEEGSGENDRYVKFNIADGSWDYGELSRSAWIDRSVLGEPIGGDDAGFLQQHETSYNADGEALNAWIKSGFVDLAEGKVFLFIDQLIPDFKYLDTDAELTVTIYVRDYPGGDERTLGPFTVTPTTTFISFRARGRQMAIKVESDDLDSFWRLGACRYRSAPSGQR